MLGIYKKVHQKPKFAFMNVLVFVFVSLLYFIFRSESIQNVQRSRNLEKHENPESSSFLRQIHYFIWPEKKLKDKLRHRALTWETTMNNARQHKREKRYPDAIIVGAERCGSSALTDLIRLHPLIKVASPIDLKFFTANYAKGPLYYKEKMPWSSPEEIVLESSSTYFSWPPMAVPKRIKSILPNVKILVLLCDPVHRAKIDFIEEFQFQVKNHRITKTSKYEILLGTYLKKFSAEKLSKYRQWDEKIQSIFFDAFTEEYNSHIISSGIYYHHVVRWKMEFDSEHLMFINRQDMLQNTGNEFEKIQKFLQIPSLIFKEDFVKDNETRTSCFNPIWMSQSRPPDVRCPLRTESKIHSEQSQSCVQSLTQFYEPYNRKLYKLLGNNYGW
ncbi:heparan sulfate glucosamine 3-O-sulfotransferase 5-like isoform X1 [Styela clava]